jgi:uncharacterized repeat protein (TIGR01451 family)
VVTSSAPAGVVAAGGSPGPNLGTKTIPKGSDPLGAIQIDPTPQIVIDPATDDGMYVQVVDAGNAGSRHGNLAFSQRLGGVWTPLTGISQPDYVAAPVLSETHDQASVTAGTPEVVVYKAADLPPDSTRSQYFAAQDIRYRYFDDRSWNDEQSLTSNDLEDSAPAVSFNAAAQGVVAWGHNTDPNPLSDSGMYERAANETHVAVWDPTTHRFSAPVTLTNDAVADGHPTVLAGADGMLRVARLRDTAGGGTEVCFSTYDGAKSSAPAPLSTVGLPSQDAIQDIRLADDASGLVHVLMAIHGTSPDGTVDSRLVDRVSPEAGWTQPATVQTVAQGAHFSNLRMTRDASGGLIAYWQASDGNDNSVWGSRFDPGPSGPASWSSPFQLTNNTDAAVEPTLAVDTNGRLQVAYDHQVPVGQQGDGTSTDPSIAGRVVSGDVMTSSVRLLPELSFSRVMSFPYRDQAASGTQAVADAQIVNCGLAATDVSIQFYDGLPDQKGTLVGTRKVHLSPGQTYDVEQPYDVLDGSHVYAMEPAAAGGVEMIGTDDNTSSVSLVGLTDLTVAGVTLSDPTPHGGEVVTVTVKVQNLSDHPVNNVAVSLALADPALAFESSNALGSWLVAGLAAFGQATETFSWPVPAVGGTFELTATVDPADTIAEAVESNNAGHLDVSVLPDAAIREMAATLLEKSGEGNAQITADIANTGAADLTNVQVTLLWSLNNGAFQVVSTQTISALPHQGFASVSFTADALAGQDRYRLIVDPAGVALDCNRTNNIGDQLLVVQALPDLTVVGLSLNPSSPIVGSPFFVRAVIANAGIAPAQGVLVEVFDGIPGTDVLLGSTTVDNVQPLGSVAVSIPVVNAKLTPGIHILVVVVDRLEKILEITDLNKDATIAATVVTNDVTPPTCTVSPLPPFVLSPRFTVNWSGHDNPGGTGIADFDIYDSVDGGAFVRWLTHTTANSVVFTGAAAHTYSFYSVATDRAGDVQPTPRAQATTTVLAVRQPPILGLASIPTIPSGNGPDDSVSVDDAV